MLFDVAYTKTIIKSAGPRLVPFLKTTAVFFILYPDKSPNSLLYLILKCAPIACLIGFVLSNGVNMSKAFNYNRRVSLGLAFSLLGDAALVFDNGFLLGIGMFALAQFCYTWAFGMSPLKLGLGACFGAMATALYGCVAPLVQSLSVQCAGFVYAILIFTMLWRATARVRLSIKDVGWTSLCSLIGAILFVCSDLLLVINKFILPLPHAHTVVMVTYYAAQLGIALSIVESHIDSVMQLSRDEVATGDATFLVRK